MEKLHRWSLGMDMKLHSTIYWAWDYLSMLVSTLIRVSKRGFRKLTQWYLEHNKDKFFRLQNVVYFVQASVCHHVNKRFSVRPKWPRQGRQWHFLTNISEFWYNSHWIIVCVAVVAKHLNYQCLRPLVRVVTVGGCIDDIFISRWIYHPQHHTG